MRVVSEREHVLMSLLVTDTTPSETAGTDRTNPPTSKRDLVAAVAAATGEAHTRLAQLTVPELTAKLADEDHRHAYRSTRQGKCDVCGRGVKAHTFTVADEAERRAIQREAKRRATVRANAEANAEGDVLAAINSPEVVALVGAELARREAKPVGHVCADPSCAKKANHALLCSIRLRWLQSDTSGGYEDGGNPASTGELVLVRWFGIDVARQRSMNDDEWLAAFGERVLAVSNLGSATFAFGGAK